MTDDRPADLPEPKGLDASTALIVGGTAGIGAGPGAGMGALGAT